MDAARDRVMEADQSAVVCPCCESASVQTIGSSQATYRLMRCLCCHHGFTDPLPSKEDLNAYYQNFFFSPGAAETEDRLQDACASLEFMFGRLSKGDHFLDYGGGTGYYARAATHLGCEVTLMDVDDAALKYAIERSPGLRIARCDEDLEVSEYAAIFLFHVIEHCRDPVALLEGLKRFLRPGGRVVIATPNGYSLEKFARPCHAYRYFKRLREAGITAARSWYLVLRSRSIFCWDPPRHLHSFNPDSIRALATRCGFRFEVRCGYNTSKLFEPRGYTLPRIPFRDALQSKRAFNALLRYWGIRTLGILFPRRGDQLYINLRMT